MGILRGPGSISDINTVRRSVMNNWIYNTLQPIDSFEFIDGKIYISGDFILKDLKATKLNPPFPIYHVHGDVILANSQLETLDGCPEVVDGNFDCSGCKNLKSLKGAPKNVSDCFDCSNCPKLKSLNGAPETVEGNFDCSNCPKLKSLNGAPKYVREDFTCVNSGIKNVKVTS